MERTSGKSRLQSVGCALQSGPPQLDYTDNLRPEGCVLATSTLDVY
jgi:hypothetical protein